MNPDFEFIVRALIIGIGATAVLDLWSIVLKRLFGIPSADWGMVGRWFGHFPQGRFVHDSIGAAAPVRGERLIGWSAHYAIGIFYAVLLLAIWGLDWARQPTLLPALILALVALVAPFFIMQPGMGAGIAASRTPNPTQARLRSVINHSVFGVGLYVSAVLAAMLLPPAVA
ncbi:MAG TPA: DUF2938 domain-containing protein [Sphingomicrobium sp.]|nr:DUF2938 domain-containing protein [Sphingomicrobium sp.]